MLRIFLFIIVVFLIVILTVLFVIKVNLFIVIITKNYLNCDIFGVICGVS